MGIYKIRMKRHVRIVERGDFDVVANSSEEARTRAKHLLEADVEIHWNERDVIEGVALGAKIVSVELIADGDEKISPQPQD